MEEALKKMPVVKIKELCRSKNLTVSGNKDVLIERLKKSMQQTQLAISNNSLLPKVSLPSKSTLFESSSETDNLIVIKTSPLFSYHPISKIVFYENPMHNKSTFHTKLIATGVYKDEQIFPLDKETVYFCKENNIPYDWTQIALSNS
ncbi:putative SAP domain-containing protein [Scale drop disease virus]|uniref:ORF_027L n=1 Tax=Scale drop disease virus TaxID=1697349 RepID=A0A0K1L652_9VIRU|nr:ORF_027L [Scale drop disease virus]AKU37442.1 ORF_027L [Scale drop disease virus]QLI60699.1 putative SAP domain-containing protein [Scale drop disease virus]QXJ13617.1 ORF027L [Scale drop disease virus]UNH60756.1 putative SAP domain-containing protein [Scale drop disease virus]